MKADAGTPAAPVAPQPLVANPPAIVGVDPNGAPIVPPGTNGAGTPPQADPSTGGTDDGGIGSNSAPPAAPGLDLYKLKPWDCQMSEDKLPLTTTLCIKSSFLAPIITEFQSKMSKQVEEGFNKLDFDKFKKYDDTSTEIKVDKFALD